MRRNEQRRRLLEPVAAADVCERTSSNPVDEALLCRHLRHVRREEIRSAVRRSTDELGVSPDTVDEFGEDVWLDVPATDGEDRGGVPSSVVEAPVDPDGGVRASGPASVWSWSRIWPVPLRHQFPELGHGPSSVALTHVVGHVMVLEVFSSVGAHRFQEPELRHTAGSLGARHQRSVHQAGNGVLDIDLVDRGGRGDRATPPRGRSSTANTQRRSKTCC